MRVFKNLLHSFSTLAAIHLFISSHDEIKDFCSMEKMAAVTGGVHNTIQLIKTKELVFTGSHFFIVICKEFSMRNA